MHKVFYASGFLFHPQSEQILLQQLIPDDERSWSLFTKQVINNKTTEENFKEIFLERFSFEISIKSIYKVYDYFSDTFGNQKIYYAEIKNLRDFSTDKGVCKWFTQKQISKLQIAERTMRDIIVGIRVIKSEDRKRLGERTIG